MFKSRFKKIKELNKEQGGIIDILIYRKFSVYITTLLVPTKITPNLVTTISTLLAFVSAIFYYQADYASLVIGTVILTLSYILDCVDGDLARYKKMTSNFGAWWDSIGDRITEYVILSSLTLGLYFKTTNPTALILGMFALANIMMISTIRNLNKVYLDTTKQAHELCFGEKKRYLDGAAFFILLVTVTTLLNQVYYLLWIYVVLGALVWIRQIYRKIIVNFKTQS